MRKLLTLLLISIFITAICYTASITVTSPTGGTLYKQGDILNISWNGSELSNQVKITLWKNNSLIGLIVKDQPANGTYRWTVGQYLGGSACGSGYEIKIREQGGASFTTVGLSGSFTIANITLTSPNGGENWTDGSTQNITWTSCGINGNVTIELIRVILNRASYSTAKALYTGNTSNGSFSWVINENLRRTLQGNKVENTYRIRITSVSNSSIKDMSDRSFTIKPKSTVLRPGIVLKPDFEVKDIYYKKSGGNSIVASIINKGYKYKGVLKLKYEVQGGESKNLSTMVDMGRGNTKVITMIRKTMQACESLSLNVEVDSTKSIVESNENNNIKRKRIFATLETDVKIESVKVLSDEGRWTEVQDGGFIRKRTKMIKIQVKARLCGGTRVEGIKVGANWNYISQFSGTTYKKRRYFPDSSVFYKKVGKWLPCQDFIKNIQGITNGTIRPSMPIKIFTITGDLDKKHCTKYIKIIKNEITVYIDSGESGVKNRNNTLKFRIKTYK